MRREVPAGLAGTIREVHGEAGETWLAQLPELLRAWEERWGLEVGEPFEPLSYNFAARARRGDGEALVLKAGIPSQEMRCEAEALRAWDGRGSVRLLEADLKDGALLLERLEPGTPLVEVEDDAAAT